MKWYLVSTILTGVFSIVITLLINWNFQPKDIGIYGLISSTVSFFLIILYLGLDQSLVRNFSNNIRKDEVLYNCFIPVLCFFVFSLVISLLNYKEISFFLFGQISLEFILITYTFTLLMIIQRFGLIMLRCNGESKKFAINNILNKFLFFLFILFIIIFHKNEENFYINYAIIFSLLICNIIMIKNFFIIKSKEVKKINLKYIKYGFPLFLSALIIGFLNYFDKFLINKWYGIIELGKYVAIYNTGLIFSYFTSMINILWMPFIFKNKDKNIISLINSFSIVFGISSLIFSIFIFLIKDYIYFLLPENYSYLSKFIYFVLANCIMYTWSEIASSVILLNNKSIYNLFSMILNLLFILFFVSFLKNYNIEYFFLLFFVGNFIALFSKFLFANKIDPNFEIYYSTILLSLFFIFSMFYFFDFLNYSLMLFIFIFLLFFVVKFFHKCYFLFKNNDYIL